MTDEEIKKNINEITGTLTKKNLSYALSIFKALQQGEEAIKEEHKTSLSTMPQQSAHSRSLQ